MYAFLAGVVPSLIWLFFWTREDRDQPEPKMLLAGLFLSGMIMVIVAIPVEQYIAGLTTTAFSQYTFWAAVEEILKFSAVALVALRTRAYDEPIDAMIYCITVALGFAALENTLFIMGPLTHGELAASIVTGNMRFIGATLVHIVSSGLIGFGLGEAFYRGAFAKAMACALGLAAAITVHASFNLSIVSSTPADALKTFGWIWGGVVVMILLFEEIKAVRPVLA